jgi:hypothetical protein
MDVPTDGQRWERKESAPAHERHLLYFFEKENFAGETVAAYLERGLIAGERILIIAVAAHAREIVTALEARGWKDLGEDRLHVCDADEGLSRIMAGGMPDPARFRSLLGEFLAQRPGVPVRAYGEMSDVLHLRGNPEAALAVEDLWEEVLRQQPIGLLCAGTIDAFLDPATNDRLFELVSRHADAYPSRV